MKKKEPIGTISLQVKAQEAQPSPPIGPALGQRGLNIMQFCQQFNERSKSMPGVEKGDVLPVKIRYYADKSFDFEVRSMPVPNQLKKRAKLASAAKKPGTEIVGSVTMDDIRAIAKNKMSDMSVDNLDAAVSMVIGTAKSMGIEVKGA